ncbi:fimbrillin family protein [Bacteroides sp.]|uniref:fimbrillin family protein n=1 Tax=Bacteroides sp. TaxID=29523 RepID=UPI002590D4E4|nr:fimbrillin family protein [Bacteroides sp.]
MKTTACKTTHRITDRTQRTNSHRFAICPLSIVLYLALLTGCSNDLDTYSNVASPAIVTFEAAVTPMTAADAAPSAEGTRAVVDGTFEEGETIGVVDKSIPGVVHCYVYHDGQFVPATDADAIHWNEGETLKVIAAWRPYPYIQLNTITHQPHDQRKYDDFDKANILLSRATIDRNTQPVLTFTRNLYTRITVNLRAGEGTSQNDIGQATLKLLNLCTNEITIDDRGTYTASYTPNDILPYERIPATTSYLRTFEAIVRSDALLWSKDDTYELIRITIGNRNYSYHKPKGTELFFLPGEHQTYNVTVNSK